MNTDPIKDYIAPTVSKQRKNAEEAYALEERLKSHPDDVDENAVGEVRFQDNIFIIDFRDTQNLFAMFIPYFHYLSNIPICIGGFF